MLHPHGERMLYKNYGQVGRGGPTHWSAKSQPSDIIQNFCSVLPDILVCVCVHRIVIYAS
jgi:hypothetical protein